MKNVLTDFSHPNHCGLVKNMVYLKYILLKCTKIRTNYSREWSRCIRKSTNVWLEADLEDADLSPELARIEGNDEEIKDRFAVALKFGTAGLRGVLGAGTNRMNIYVVRQATQGLANWVKTQGGTQTVAISYDSRLKSRCICKDSSRCSGSKRNQCQNL